MAKTVNRNRAKNGWRGHQDSAVWLAIGHALGAQYGRRDVGSSHSAGEPDCAYLVRLEGSTMVLLYGFIKKTSATPKTDLDLAKDRFQLLRRSSS